MKKLFLGLLAVSSMAMVGCSQDEEQWALGGDTFEDFTGEIVTDGSRTSMGTDGSVLWSENDTISLFKKTGYHQKYKVAESGSTSTTFKYADYSTQKGATQAMHYAVYPFAEGNSISGTTLTLDLSSLATQSYTANTFENGKAVMVAKSENTALTFTNAFSLANFQLTAQAGEAPDEKILVNSIKVESATLPLAGSATVDMSQEKPAAVFASTGSKSITLTCENAVELSATAATNFYVLMPDTTFQENDLTITIYATVAEEAKEYVVTMSSEVEFLRSKVTTLTKTLEFDGWTGVTSATVVDVADVTAANTALATSAGVKIADASTATGTTAITVPAKEAEEAEVSHVIDLSEATMPTDGTAVNIVVTEGDGSTANTVETLEVIVPEGTDSQSLNINAPGTTVTVTAADGTVIDVIEATTAEQTLVINENVTVKKLIVKKGNVRIKGKVGSIESDINTTITLDNDIILDSPLTVSGTGQIILDLNGYALSYTSATAGDAMITNNGTLTVKDSGTDGKITYSYTGEADNSYSKGNYTIFNNGTLTIENGIVENTTSAMSHAFYAINTGSGATLTINGGKVINKYGHAVRMVNFNSGANTMNVNGGYIEGTRAVQMQLPSSDSSSAPEMSLTITNGELKSNETTYNLAVYVYSAGQSGANVKINVSGGTVDGNIALNKAVATNMVDGAVSVSGGTVNGQNGVFSYADDAVSAGKISISGGTFASNSCENHVAPGYSFVEENGVYKVQYDSSKAVVNNETELSTALADESISTIVLGTDIDVANGINVTRSITLDGNGKTINFTGSYTNNGTLDSRLIEVGNATSGASLTLKNMTIVNKNSFVYRVVNYNTSGTLTLNNVTIEHADNCSANYAVNLPGKSDGCTVVINNCNIGATAQALNIWGTNSTITVTDSHLYIIDNSTEEGYSVIAVNDDGSGNSAAPSVVTVTGGSLKVTGTAASDSYAVRNNTTSSTITISETTEVVGDIVEEVAIVYYEGQNEFYSTSTLAGAITKAKETNAAGIRLIRDVTCGEALLIDSSLKIEGNSHTLTTSATRAIRLTTSDIAVEISNLNIVSTAVASSSSDVRGIAIDANLSGVDLALNQCAVDFTDSSTCDWTYGVNVAGNTSGIKLTINGGTYEGANVVNIWGSQHTINIDGATLNSTYKPNVQYSGVCVKLSEGTSGHDVTIKNTTFNSPGGNAMATEDKGSSNTITQEGNTDNTKTATE